MEHLPNRVRDIDKEKVFENECSGMNLLVFHSEETIWEWNVLS